VNHPVYVTVVVAFCLRYYTLYIYCLLLVYVYVKKSIIYIIHLCMHYACIYIIVYIVAQLSMFTDLQIQTRGVCVQQSVFYTTRRYHIIIYIPIAIYMRTLYIIIGTTYIEYIIYTYSIYYSAVSYLHNNVHRPLVRTNFRVESQCFM